MHRIDVESPERRHTDESVVRMVATRVVSASPWDRTQLELLPRMPGATLPDQLVGVGDSQRHTVPEPPDVSSRQRMRYQEYNPPVELASWIRLFWVFESRSNDRVPETIVADGFPELIIHFGLPFAEADRAGQFQKQPAAVACGQLTRPLVLLGSPDAGMVGIRFQPSGMAPFVSTSMHSIADARVPAEDLFVDVDQLVEEISGSSNDAQRIAACKRFLFRSIDPHRENACVRPALENIMRTHGQISVESLAARVGTSRRSLEMAFQREVGASPKMYCRITRFRHIFDAISKNSPSVDWALIALDSGFFDQPHMIRDFRQFTGASPTSFLVDQSLFAHSVNRG